MAGSELVVHAQVGLLGAMQVDGTHLADASLGDFGTGIAATPNDLGANGVRPTHPKLVDWLASELVETLLPPEEWSST